MEAQCLPLAAFAAATSRLRLKLALPPNSPIRCQDFPEQRKRWIRAIMVSI
jgi:hypothetical protein